MQCPRCQHPNTETAKFCEECGNRLVRTCPACGHEVGPTAKFCAECGEPLLRQSQVPLPRQSQVPSPKSQVENGSDSTLQILDSSGLRTADLGLRTSPEPSGLRTADLGLQTSAQPAERILVEQTALGVRGSVEGERKTITALFADIK